MAITDVNKVIMTGRLWADPEITPLESGGERVRFAIAVGKYDKSCKDNVKTDSHLCFVFGHQVNFVKKHIKKGDKVFIEGEWRIYEKKYSETDIRKTDYIDVKDIKIMAKKQVKE